MKINRFFVLIQLNFCVKRLTFEQKKIDMFDPFQMQCNDKEKIPTKNYINKMKRKLMTTIGCPINSTYLNLVAFSQFQNFLKCLHPKISVHVYVILNHIGIKFL